MDFGKNLVFVNQKHKVENPKLLWNIKVLGIFLGVMLHEISEGDAIGDWMACEILIQPKINYY